MRLPGRSDRSRLALGAAALIVVLVGSDAAAQSIRDHTRREMRATLAEFLVKMDRSKARARLTEIVDRDPSYPEAVFNLALLAEADGDHRNATALYERALQLAPSAPLKQMTVAALDRLKRGTQSVANYEGIVQQAAAFQGAGLSAFAVARAADAITLAPDRWEAHAVSASAFRALRDYEKARASLKKALSAAPRDAQDRLRQEIVAIDHDIACAPIVTGAAEAYEKKDYKRAGDLFASAWRQPCGKRDEIGLAAASAYVKGGDRTAALPVLNVLVKSSNALVVERATALTDDIRK